MDVRDFLSQDHALVDVRAADKHRLLKELCHRAALPLQMDGERISQHILKREELGSTGVGGGVAIPHARIEELQRPFGVLVRLRQAIDFDAIDGEPVDIVFLLLLPAAAAGEHLNALASVARRLRDPKVVEALRRAEDSVSLHRAMMPASR